MRNGKAKGHKRKALWTVELYGSGKAELWEVIKATGYSKILF
jgi:hypothetical protein